MKEGVCTGRGYNNVRPQPSGTVDRMDASGGSEAILQIASSFP